MQQGKWFRSRWFSKFRLTQDASKARPVDGSGHRFRLEHLEDRSVPAALPILNSLPGAAVTFHLDFDGDTTASWGSQSNIVTPPWDLDGNPTDYNDQEIATITTVWKRVAEDFAPFPINITTVDPGPLQDLVSMKVDIGGNGAWAGSPGGIALLGSFSNGAQNTVYVFSDNLGPNVPNYMADAASHELGHSLGLQHHARWTNGNNGGGYDPGLNGWGPIMGAPYDQELTVWDNGPTQQSETTLQDDLSIIIGSSNAFGYRADDHGDNAFSADALTRNNFTYTGSGIITTTADIDAFSFDTGPGTVKVTFNPATVGANLVGQIELRDATGTLIASSATPDQNLAQTATISTFLSAGSYRVYVKSQGSYGRIGTYNIVVDTPITGPRVTSATPTGVQKKPVGSIDFKFDQSMDTSSFDINSDVVTFTGPGGINLKSQITSYSWVDNTTLRVNFTFQSTNGDYSMTLGSNILSTNNLNMDQNLDGLQGTVQDRYTSSFKIAIFGGSPDRYEPNDTLGAAFNFGTVRNLIEKNLSINVSYNDDYFKFTAASSGTYVVSINFNNDDGDLDLFTFNDQGVVNGFSTTTNNVEQVSFNATAGTTYYVRITGFFGSASPNYGMRIAGPTAGPDRFELNDSFAGATNFGNVRKRVEKGLSIDKVSDQDFYTFTATVTGSYTVSTSFFNDFGNLDLTVYDGAQNQIGFSNGSSDGESIQLNLVGGQTYTVRVKGVGPAVNDYDLSITAPGRTDIVGRDPTTGVLWVGLANNFGQYSTAAWGVFSTNVTWVDVTSGDFNGDGWTDVAGRISQTGEWYVGLSNGATGYTTTKWGTWPAGNVFKDVVVGDFNGDGRSEIAGRLAATQQWYVALSQPGNTFSSAIWGTWSQASDWLDVRVGDFDGDGRSDVVGRSKDNGDWIVGLANGSNGFSSGKWSRWTSTIAWADVIVGDFDGDGRSDLTGRWAETGQWYTALSIGPSGFATSLWSTWSGHAGAFKWLDVRAGDFDGDGKTDITGRDSTTGNWWTGLSGTGANKGHFVTSYWSTWSANVIWADVLVGDFNGDGRADITGRDKGTGNWWTAQSYGAGFATSYWATWTASINWADVHAADYGNNG